MVDVLVVFGSKSDKDIYEKIKLGKLEICSAHRNPDKLHKLIAETDAKVIMAGAGLAAALPGVIASKTIKPVIGIPVSSNFQGLDSMLSIVQMPPNIPVLCVGVDNAESAATYAEKIVKGFQGINIIENEKYSERIEKAKKTLKDFGVEFTLGQEREGFINLDFIDIKEQYNIKENNHLVINVPMLESSTANDSLQLMNIMKKGLWVGLNRAENAALAAIEIINATTCDYSDKLNQFRKGLR